MLSQLSAAHTICPGTASDGATPVAVSDLALPHCHCLFHFPAGGFQCSLACGIHLPAWVRCKPGGTLTYV